MRKLSLLALILGLAACRSDDGGGGDDMPTPDSNTTNLTVQDVQNDSMTPGTRVDLEGVVVTAIDNFGARTGDFWVQAPGGGEFSGVQVFGAPLDQVAALQVGDVVDIKDAQKAEFALSADTSGNTLTELEPVDGGVMTVTKTGQTMTITPSVVDAAAIGALADFTAREAEWEKWEGVVVTLSNITALSDPECITSMGTCNDDTYQRFDITGDIQVQSALAALPESPVIARGDCFSAVSGIVTYFFDYQILPRQTSDIGTGGTACPVENDAALCADTMDNDSNGFTDCADNACIIGAPTCRMAYAISDLQPSAAAITSAVELQDVRVVAVSFNKKNMWVQTDQQAAANEGMYVRGPGDDLDGFAVGSRVDIIGRVTEFKPTSSTGTETLTQITALEITAGTGATEAPLPVANQLASALLAAGEPMESVFVELQNVKVTTVGVSPNYITTLTQAGGTAFKADDDIYRFVSGDAAKCYSSIKGFWSYNAFEGDWVFLPRRNGTALDATEAGSSTACD